MFLPRTCRTRISEVILILYLVDYIVRGDCLTCISTRADTNIRRYFVVPTLFLWSWLFDCDFGYVEVGRCTLDRTLAYRVQCSRSIGSIYLILFSIKRTIWIETLLPLIFWEFYCLEKLSSKSCSKDCIFQEFWVTYTFSFIFSHFCLYRLFYLFFFYLSICFIFHFFIMRTVSQWP